MLSRFIPRSRWLGAYPRAFLFDGERSVDACEQALQDVTRKSLTGGWNQRPFVGYVRQREGRLWFSRRRGLAHAARSLRFRLVEHGTGCRLTGELSLILPLRAFTLFYVLFCIVGGGGTMVASLLHGASVLYGAWLFVRSMLVGVGFLFAYGGLAVSFGRRAEELGLKIIKHIMTSESNAAVAIDLLSSSR